MTTYIALLRGINVSGKNKILMKPLVIALEPLNLKQITTYIQSGNIVFQSPKKSTKELEKDIEMRILDCFDLTVSVIVITLDELNSIEKNNPYHLLDIEIDKKYGCFLKSLPDEIGMEKLSRFNSKNDEYTIVNQFIYLNYFDRAGNSKLTTNLIENKMNVIGTARNWKTILKLIEIGNAVSL